MLEVCVLLSVTGRQWVSRYTRFSCVGSLCVTFSDWETMGVSLYEVFLYCNEVFLCVLSFQLVGKPV